MSGYILSADARRDLREIRRYLRKQSGAAAADRVLQALRDGMRRVAAMPGLGHLREDLAREPLRFYRVYSYLIIYRPRGKPLQIVRVLHGARDVRSVLSTGE